MTLNYRSAYVRVERNLQIQQVLAEQGDAEVLNIPSLMGPTGVGKTSMARDLAKAFGLPYRGINNGENSDPTDISGVPVPMMLTKLMKEGTESERADAELEHMKWVLNQYAAEACASGVFLHFDDIDKAPRQIQGALLGIAGNRMFRDKPVHPHTLLMFSGNRAGKDDVLASALSESLRTRISIIEMEPDAQDFYDYAERTGRIHEVVVGFLNWKPDLVYKWNDNENRYPTPRGWREVSVHFQFFPDPYEKLVVDSGVGDNWHQVVSEKCGTSVGRDFWAWFRVLRQIDVDKILRTGKVDQALQLDGKAADKRMMQYAAIFAVAQKLNTGGISPTYKGLDVLFDSKNADSVHPDLRVALGVQLKRQVRAQLSELFPKASNEIMKTLVSTSQEDNE